MIGEKRSVEKKGEEKIGEVMKREVEIGERREEWRGEKKSMSY